MENQPQRAQSSQRLMLYERVGARIRLQLTAFLDASICQVFTASTSTPLELLVKQIRVVAGCSSLGTRRSVFLAAEDRRKSNCKMQKCTGKCKNDERCRANQRTWRREIYYFLFTVWDLGIRLEVGQIFFSRG